MIINMNAKAQKFTEFLKAINLDSIFQVREVPNADGNPVAYSTAMEVDKQNLPFLLVIDDSIYTMIQVRVAGQIVKPEKRPAVVEYLNGLNENYKVFKYYVSAEGDIVIESCLVFTDDNFAPELIHAVINVILQHLNEEYSKIMKVIWAE